MSTSFILQGLMRTWKGLKEQLGLTNSKKVRKQGKSSILGLGIFLMKWKKRTFIGTAMLSPLLLILIERKI